MGTKQEPKKLTKENKLVLLRILQQGTMTSKNAEELANMVRAFNDQEITFVVNFGQ